MCKTNLICKVSMFFHTSLLVVEYYVIISMSNIVDRYLNYFSFKKVSVMWSHTDIQGTRYACPRDAFSAYEQSGKSCRISDTAAGP